MLPRCVLTVENHFKITERSCRATANSKRDNTLLIVVSCFAKNHMIKKSQDTNQRVFKKILWLCAARDFDQTQGNLVQNNAEFLPDKMF